MKISFGNPLGSSIEADELAAGVLTCKVLGSGTFLNSGVASQWSDAGNFSIDGDIGEGFIRVLMFSECATHTHRISIGNATGDSDLLSPAGAIGNVPAILDIMISKGLVTTQATIFGHDGDGDIVLADAQALDLSATETFYLKAKEQTATGTQRVRWIAMQYTEV